MFLCFWFLLLSFVVKYVSSSHRKKGVEPIEKFAQTLSEHFLSTQKQVDGVEISVERKNWEVRLSPLSLLSFLSAFFFFFFFRRGLIAFHFSSSVFVGFFFFEFLPRRSRCFVVVAAAFFLVEALI